jgi:hypothetical protein
MYANVQAGYSHFDAVWDGGGADNRWSTEGNWLTVGPPTNRFAVFTGTTRLDTTNDLPAGTRINGLQFRRGRRILDLGRRDLPPRRGGQRIVVCAKHRREPAYRPDAAVPSAER